MVIEELPLGKPGQIMKLFSDGATWVDLTAEDEKKVWDSIHDDEDF